MNSRAFFACIFLSLFPFGLSASADDWTEYSTPHFLRHENNQYDYAQKYVKKISKASPQYSELQQQYEAHKKQEKVLKAAEKNAKKRT